jgi:hypothetical protein
VAYEANDENLSLALIAANPKGTVVIAVTTYAAAPKPPLSVCSADSRVAYLHLATMRVMSSNCS